MTRVHSGQRGPCMQDFGMIRLESSGSDCSFSLYSPFLPYDVPRSWDKSRDVYNCYRKLSIAVDIRSGRL
jgi:hypothetical protein